MAPLQFGCPESLILSPSPSSFTSCLHTVLYCIKGKNTKNKSSKKNKQRKVNDISNI